MLSGRRKHVGEHVDFYRWRFLNGFLFHVSFWFVLFVASVDGSGRIPESSVSHYIDYYVNNDLGLMDGRKGIAVQASLVGWIPELTLGDPTISSPSKKSAYKPNTIALTIGTNNYFYGNLISDYVRDHASSPYLTNLDILGNKYIFDQVNRIREYLLTDTIKLMLKNFGDKIKSYNPKIHFYWLQPLSHKHKFVSDQMLSLPIPMLHDGDGIIPGMKIHNMLEGLGICQKLEPPSTIPDWFTNLKTTFTKAVNEVKAAKTFSTNDIALPSTLPSEIPEFSFHHLYGGWYDIRGIVVIEGLEEPQTEGTKGGDVLAIPKPIILRQSNFLSTKTVNKKLTDAITEYTLYIKSLYLDPPMNDQRAKYIPLMKWKDITETQRLVVRHHNSHFPPTEYIVNSLWPPNTWAWPAVSSVPPTSFLLSVDPIFFIRLTQFSDSQVSLIGSAPSLNSPPNEIIVTVSTVLFGLSVGAILFLSIGSVVICFGASQTWIAIERMKIYPKSQNAQDTFGLDQHTGNRFLTFIKNSFGRTNRRRPLTDDTTATCNTLGPEWESANRNGHERYTSELALCDPPKWNSSRTTTDGSPVVLGKCIS